jgi:15-cis-phytoene desaturase
MGKALDFIDSDKLSMTVILTAMNRFINETHGSKTAFLDGNQPARLCAPMAEHFTKLGGEVHVGTSLKKWIVNDVTGAVEGVELTSGEVIVGDHYVRSVWRVSQIIDDWIVRPYSYQKGLLPLPIIRP